MRRSAILAVMLGLAAPALAWKPLRLQSPPADTPPACTSLEYNGGPLIHQVKLVQVMWGAAAFSSELSAFYSALAGSDYVGALGEYGQGAQTILPGTFGGVFVDASPPPKTTLDDAVDIAPELGRLVDQQLVPAPDADTLYMIHFPPGTSITMQTMVSCDAATGDPNQVAFCAYHYFSAHAAGTLRYAVIPDMSPAPCKMGCGSSTSTDPFVATTFCASHEMAEAITDPEPNSGWSDPSCGEVADICDHDPTPGSLASYVVEKVWSASRSACFDGSTADPTITPDFNLTVDKLRLDLTSGEGGSIGLRATPIGELDTLSVWIDGLPALGVTATAVPPSLPTNGSTSINIATAPAAPPGVYPLHLTAVSSNGVSHSATCVLTLSAATNGSNGNGSNSNGSGSNGSGSNGSGSNGSNGGDSIAGDSGTTGNNSDGHMSSGGCAFVGAPGAGGFFPLLLLVAFFRRRRA